ncbi:MAG: RNA polymerase sigma factor [Gammaproteobacteria bacterium]
MSSGPLDVTLDSTTPSQASGEHSIRPFERTLKESAGVLRQFLQRHLKSPDLVADAAQETWLRMLRYREIADPAEIRALLFRVAGTVVTDLYRRSQTRQSSQHDTLEHLGLVSSDPSPERVVQAYQDLERIKSAIAGLPPRCRQAFLLHRFDGMSYKEIAQCFGTSERTVEKQVIRALAACREATGDKS